MRRTIRLICASLLPIAIISCSSPDPTLDASSPAAPMVSASSEPKDAPPPKNKTASIKEIDASQLFALRAEGKALIYDVRLPIYHKLGHIAGATLFYPKPFDEAFAREEPHMKQALSEGKEVVFYCGSEHCNDSHVVAEMVARRGIPVSVYSGGWDEWKTIGMD